LTAGDEIYELDEFALNEFAYRQANTHGMPKVAGLFPPEELLIVGLFCGK